MSHIGTRTIDYVILGVGIVSFLLTVLGARAYLRRRDRRLLFVVAAFALFALKSGITVVALAYATVAHNDLEMLNALLDLAVVLCLVSPFLVPARPRADARSPPPPR